ncbi:hypothetical protein Cus16_2866 [Curtobacterium sp. ER1/6]|nr:hypothetical protein Cus16_2866 [Curtobacterium sp. ER1/6]
MAGPPRASRPPRSALEARLALVGQARLDTCAHVRGHRGQGVEPGPGRLGVLAVRRERVPGDVPAGEDEVEVLRAVAVRVRHLGQGLHPRQALGDRDDVGLLEDLALGGHRRFLARVDDPRHRRPRAGVRASDDEQLALGALAAGDHGGDPGQPEQVGADLLAQGQDEVRGRHGSTVPITPVADWS